MDNYKAFENLVKKPETIISKAQKDSSDVIKHFLKSTYDTAVPDQQRSGVLSCLPVLTVKNFDLEQIWQQLELHHEESLTKSLINVSKVCSKKNKLIFSELENIGGPENNANSCDDIKTNDKVEEENAIETKSNNENEKIKSGDTDEVDNKGESNDEFEDEGSDLQISDSEEEHPKFKKTKHSKSAPSAVDDDFFKLNEMENFLTQEEKKSTNKRHTGSSDLESDAEMEEENIDLFNDSDEIPENDETDKLKNPKYDDFFGEPQEERTKKFRKLSIAESDLEDENENIKSTYELRKERLEKKIKRLEEETVTEKPWQLKGEITSENRPQNSLLEKVLDFDLTTRPAPVITEQTNLKLEEIILKRIKDKVFDSVERKQKPLDTPLQYKKKLVLDQEKSKESLTQIYEREYLSQKELLDPEASYKEEEEPQLHKEIKTLMHSLFHQLDALSNFHFTPRAAVPELKIIANIPSISLEEVAPLASTDASMLAPEEVKKRHKGDIIGTNERTSTDKKRQKRKRKIKQAILGEIKKKKENEDLAKSKNNKKLAK